MVYELRKHIFSCCDDVWFVLLGVVFFGQYIQFCGRAVENGRLPSLHATSRVHIRKFREAPAVGQPVHGGLTQSNITPPAPSTSTESASRCIIS